MPATDFIGLTGPEYEMDVERGAIRQFARAMGAPLPAFVEGRTPIVPAPFLITTAYTWGYTLERPRGTVFEQIDHDFSVPLHAEESFVFHGEPPRAGDRFLCQASLEDVKIKQGSQGGELAFLTMLTKYWDENGRLAVEQRSVTVTTEQSPDDDGWQIEIPPYEPNYKEIEPAAPFLHIQRAGWDELIEGEGLEPVNAGPLLIQDMVRFQGVEGEDNPLHYDVAAATAAGYPFVFGLGMHQASLLAGMASYWLDPEAVRSFKARFRQVYWPGEEMIYEAKAGRKYVDKETGHRLAELALVCKRPSGDHLVDVWMTFDFGK